MGAGKSTELLGHRACTAKLNTAHHVFCQLTLVCAEEEQSSEMYFTGWRSSVLRRNSLCCEDPTSPIQCAPEGTALNTCAADTYLLSCGDVDRCINSSRCPRNETAVKKWEGVWSMWVKASPDRSLLPAVFVAHLCSPMASSAQRGPTSPPPRRVSQIELMSNMKKKGWCKSQMYILNYCHSKLEGEVSTKPRKYDISLFFHFLQSCFVGGWHVCGVFFPGNVTHDLVVPSQTSYLNLSAKFGQHSAVTPRTLTTRDSHLRQGSRHRFLQHAQTLFSSPPAGSQLEQVKAYRVSHKNEELLKTEAPQTAALCVKSCQQVLLSGAADTWRTPRGVQVLLLWQTRVALWSHLQSDSMGLFAICLCLQEVLPHHDVKGWKGHEQRKSLWG